MKISREKQSGGSVQGGDAGLLSFGKGCARCSFEKYADADADPKTEKIIISKDTLFGDAKCDLIWI